MKLTKRSLLTRQFLLMTAGALIYAASLVLFLATNQLVSGGVSGIAIMINHLFSWAQTGTVIIVLNIPLFIVGFIKFGKKFIFSTVYGTVLASVSVNLFTTLFRDIAPLTTNPLLAALVGGSMTALGLGLVFRGGGTTGGTDIIVKLIRLKYKHIKTNTILLMVDALVVAASALVFGNIESALYSAVVLVVSSHMLDLVLYGSDSAKLIYIISDKPDEISEGLMNKLRLGVTYLEGEGAYTKRDKRVLMCATRKQSFPKIRDIVNEVDPMSFMIVSSAQEIFGEGFKTHKSSDL